MANRYLVISDLHLTDIEDHADGWMYYKSSRFIFDGEIARLVTAFTARAEKGDNLTLLLNGDVVDFDLISAVPEEPPWPLTRCERKCGMEASALKSAWKLRHVLRQHPVFMMSLARFISEGHRLVYVLGNHDRELHFPEVQQAFIEGIEEQARQGGFSLIRGTISFEPWFFYVRGEIYAEHGHQYDPYCSFRHQLAPVHEQRGEQVLALPMGDLSNRLLINRMGFFNPYATDFILNVFAYLLHWLRHYAFTRRSLFLPWFVGSLTVVWRHYQLRKKLRHTPPEHTEQLQRLSRKYNVPVPELEALGQLQRQPITMRFYRLLRELWLDRMLIALLMTGGTIALALLPVPLWVQLMVPLSSFPLLYLIYEWATRGDTVFTVENEFPQRARAVSRVLPAPVIVFGHTHKPRLIPLSRESVFVDTGTWAPIVRRQRKERLVSGLRNYLELVFEQKEEREMTLVLGSFLPDDPAARTPALTAQGDGAGPPGGRPPPGGAA